MIRYLFAGAAAMVSIAAAPPPPPSLAPYIKGGAFEPGDYGWLRGRFPGATARQKADDVAIGDWLHVCETEQMAVTRAELAAAGAPSTIPLEFSGYRDPLCAAVSFAPHPPEGTTFEAFQQTLPRARLVADTYLFAVAMAERGGSGQLAAALVLRPVSDQMLRRASFWGQGEAAAAPKLDPIELAIVTSRIGTRTVETDHANTEWLKTIVAHEGWPALSKVGEAASSNAWLLVQHADADPAFQYRALKLMAPLAAAHDLPARNYAYLYDRVMLKLAGKQRYATQMTCAHGRRMPQPLEDEGAVDALRRQAGLNPLKDYEADMDGLYGPCPPDVIPPSPAKR